MEVLNKAYAQLSATVGSMTPGARLLCGLLIVVVAVSMAYLLHDQVSGPETYLMGGETFSASQLRDMQAAFGKAGLEAQIEGAKIRIPRGQESKYMAALAEAGALPAEFGDYLNRAVTSANYFGSRQQQEAALRVARQRELQNILNHLPGIEKSAVQIDEQMERGLHPKKLVTASVNIVPKNSQPLDEARIRAIRCAVASSIAGLKPEGVTVVDLGAARSYPGTSSADGSSAGGDYAELKRRLEADWQEKIAAALAYIPGVLVRTNVELDREIMNEETTRQFDGEAPGAARRPHQAKSLDAAIPLAISRLVGGKPNPPDIAKDPPRDVASQNSDAPAKSTSPAVERHIVREGRTPKRVTVSIAVPHSYYEEVWRKRNPALAPYHRPDAVALAEIEAGEKQSIAAAVAALVPQSNESGTAIAVTTFHPPARPRVINPAPEDPLLAWLAEHWSVAGLFTLALACLLVLRSMLSSGPAPAAKSSPHGNASVGQATSLLDEPGGSQSAPPPAHIGRGLRGPVLRDELADMVRDDPDAAVGVLRSWIGNAS